MGLTKKSPETQFLSISRLFAELDQVPFDRWRGELQSLGMLVSIPSSSPPPREHDSALPPAAIDTPFLVVREGKSTATAATGSSVTDGVAITELQPPANPLDAASKSAPKQLAAQQASAPTKQSAHRKKAMGPSNAAKRTHPPLTTVRVPRPDEMEDGSTSTPLRKSKTPATSQAIVATPSTHASANPSQSRPTVAIPTIHIPAAIFPPQVAAPSAGDPVKRPTHAGKTILVVPLTTDNLKQKSPKEDEDDIEDFSDEDGSDMEIDDEPPRKPKKTQKKKRRVVSVAYVEISDEDEGGGPTMMAAVTTPGNGKKVPAPPASDITLLKAPVPCDQCQLFDESCWTFMEKP